MEPRQRNCLPVADNASTAPVQVGASPVARASRRSDRRHRDQL